MSEIGAVKKTVIDDLLATGSLTAVVSTRVYDEVTPQPAVFPYMRIRVQPGRNRNVIGAKVFEEFDLFVEAIREVNAATPSHKATQDIYDIADAVVRDSFGTVGADEVRGFIQKGTYQFFERGDGGKMYSVCGARFTGYAYSTGD